MTYKKSVSASVFVSASLLASALLFSTHAQARPLWAEGEDWPVSGIANPYDLASSELPQVRRQGLMHALYWPVAVTGALIPYQPFEFVTGWVQSTLGLNKYPRSEGEGVYYVPFKHDRNPKHKMGFTLMERDGAVGLTFSCAACHSSRLFGKTIIGLTNRFPGANHLYAMALKGVKKVSPEMLRDIFGASDPEVEMYRATLARLAYVEAKSPATKGLDTSLAHVALSLSHREPDEFASLTDTYRNDPREEPLRNTIADSKPLVWWNVKYKNRWLSDGSLVSGNPIFTNFIWNEIGRGTDLHELSDWFEKNENVIKELTTAVYSSQAPRITDFYAAEKINLERAQKGEVLFKNKCAKCHGQYVKAWSQTNAPDLTPDERLRTIEVQYFRQTPVKDVGTDPQRHEGIASLMQLNNLKISRDNKIVIRQQKGYVPPPLVGIWARFPYFHNNSIPNLCELLRPPHERVQKYFAGQVVERERHFDFDCGGYPVRHKTPIEWTAHAEYEYDTRRPGMSNQGHDIGFASLTPNDRKNLIQFLLTL